MAGIELHDVALRTGETGSEVGNEVGNEVCRVYRGLINLRALGVIEQDSFLMVRVSDMAESLAGLLEYDLGGLNIGIVRECLIEMQE